MKRAVILSFAAMLPLSACVTGIANLAPVTVMKGVTRQAKTCWFDQKDPRFADYRLQAELTSFSNRPRILVVPKGSRSALPVLIAQAEHRDGRTTFQSFGPLLDSPQGPSIAQELDAWANGSRTC
jgi:hypothetical protein